MQPATCSISGELRPRKETCRSLCVAHGYHFVLHNIYKHIDYRDAMIQVRFKPTTCICLRRFLHILHRGTLWRWTGRQVPGGRRPNPQGLKKLPPCGERTLCNPLHAVFQGKYCLVRNPVVLHVLHMANLWFSITYTESP